MYINGHRLFGAGEKTKLASEGQLLLFANNGDEVCIRSNEDSHLELLLLAGRPLNEEVVRYGPFVMNTHEEIIEAFKDYEQGRMGKII